MVFPTAYLPSINYMSKCLNQEEILVEIFETYTKQTCRNHCEIYSPNGKQTLSIPVIKTHGNHTLTRDIRISYRMPWQKIHWRSIETAYNNSPFLLYYKDSFIPAFTKRYDFLIDFNRDLLEAVFSSLRITKQIRWTPSFTIDPSPQEREKLVSKKLRFHHLEYTQVFIEKHGFLYNLSVIDCLFNLGPETGVYLGHCTKLI